MKVVTKTTYSALLELHLQYDIPVWGSTGNNNLEGVIVQQKKVTNKSSLEW